MKILVGAAAAVQTACAADKPKTDGGLASTGPEDDSASSGEAFTSGYMVVDPVPSPSRCGGEMATKLTATALLRPSQKGNDVVLTLRSTNGTKVKVGAAEQILIDRGGTMPAVTKEIGNDLEISFLYDGQTPDVDVDMPVICEADVGRMRAMVSIDPSRQIPNAPLRATLTAGYGY
ncbi:MAG: hypothetical protein U0414_06685 [Polyangiaceae bacterium]